VIWLLATTGIVGVLALVAIDVGGVVDWGPPGSPEYETYALVNRLTGVALALAVAAPISLWRALTGMAAERGVRRALVVLGVALCGMVVGSVAEFWVFNDQPYRGAGSEGRNLAWITFLISALTLAVGSVVTGLMLLRRAWVPRWAGLAVAAAAPVGIGATALGAPAFIAVPLIALALSTVAVSLGRRPSKPGMEVA
jgi:MFS family permease